MKITFPGAFFGFVLFVQGIQFNTEDISEFKAKILNAVLQSLRPWWELQLGLNSNKLHIREHVRYLNLKHITIVFKSV